MVDVSKAQDGGIIKKIIQDGVGDSPTSGNTVKVHYTGRLLDGTVFDSSKDRDELFTFKVGQGQVIKGWDEGIVTMKRGEIATLTCKPDYAYGERGSPPKIPPNSTLEFEVEMHDFMGEDCTENSDGCVLKTTIKEGSGLSSPREGASVNVTWSMKHLDRDLENKSIKFVLGDGDVHGVVKGLECALLKMKKGEMASVVVKSPYAYGHVGSAELAVPGGADLTYTITLEDFEQAKYKHEMSTLEKLVFAEKAKELGTEFFKSGKLDQAIKKYSQITEYLDDDMPDFSGSDEGMEDEEENKKDVEGDAEHKEKSQTVLLAGYLNLALCQIKLKNATDALKACEGALKIDPKNIKALFRRGQAAEVNEDWENAITYYKGVMEVEPSNTLASKQIRICREHMAKYKDSEKKRYANMMKCMGTFKDPEPVADSNKTKPDFSDDEADDEGSVSEGEPIEPVEV